MGTFVNGTNITLPAEAPGAVDVNATFAALTNAFNTKKITREEYRARVAELVGRQKPNDAGTRVVGFIVARER